MESLETSRYASATASGVTTLLTTVDQPGPVEAYIYVPADRARNLRIGVPVHLVDTAGNDLANSKITFISPQVDTDTQTVLAKATVEEIQRGRYASRSK